MACKPQPKLVHYEIKSKKTLKLNQNSSIAPYEDRYQQALEARNFSSKSFEQSAEQSKNRNNKIEILLCSVLCSELLRPPDLLSKSTTQPGLSSI